MLKKIILHIAAILEQGMKRHCSGSYKVNRRSQSLIKVIQGAKAVNTFYGVEFH